MMRVLKDKKFLLFLGISAVVAALVMGILVGGAPKRHNASLKKTMQKVITPIAKECGLENFEVVYVDDDYNTKIVFSCDKMSEISYDKKTKFFDNVAEMMSKQGSKYSFYKTDKLAVYSDGNRYTASMDTLTSSVYENGDVIDPTTNKIKVQESGSSAVEAAPSSGSSNKTNSNNSNKTSSSSACKGGVSCRSGYHPCHPMSNGYCNMCCKD